jgi:hypothetical protein
VGIVLIIKIYFNLDIKLTLFDFRFIPETF